MPWPALWLRVKSTGVAKGLAPCEHQLRYVVCSWMVGFSVDSTVDKTDMQQRIGIHTWGLYIAGK